MKLDFLEIGSRVFDGAFGAPTINGKITRVTPGFSASLKMSGNSSFVYTDSMNLASLGVVGSFGLSGISKVDSAVSAYYGVAKEESQKVTTIKYECISQGGVEYVDFDNLRAEQIVQSLNKRARQLCVDVLTKYNTLKQVLPKGNVSLQEVENSNEFKQWFTALLKFNDEMGMGLVVGIVWGAYGSVNLTLSESQGTQDQSYGGSAEFSYSGLGTGVAVGAAYDGNQSKNNGNIKVETYSEFKGEAILTFLESWSDLVNGKAFSEVSGLQLVKEGKDLKGKINFNVPTVESITPPPKDPELSDKIGEIKNLEGLEVLATVYSYEEKKKTDKDLTLEQFLDDSKKKNNTKPLAQLTNSVRTNTPSGNPNPPIIDTQMSIEKSIEPKGWRGECTPIGVWIAKWSDIFPWLAMGYANSVEDLEGASAILAAELQKQDFLTLSKIYYFAEECEFLYLGEKIEIFGQLGSDFESAARTGTSSLSPEAQKIYDVWVSNGFLRNAELGLGVLRNTDSLTEKVTSFNPDPFLKVKFESKVCLFSEDVKNYVVFADFLKLMPLIFNDSIYAIGPQDLALYQANSTSFTFAKDLGYSMKFVKDQDQNVLISQDIKLYPIPFSAADGLSKGWRGRSVSTNIGANASLISRMETLENDLSKLNTYSFSSENWDEDWNYEDQYSIKKLPTQYYGLEEMPLDFFSNIK